MTAHVPQAGLPRPALAHHFELVRPVLAALALPEHSPPHHHHLGAHGGRGGEEVVACQGHGPSHEDGFLQLPKVGTCPQQLPDGGGQTKVFRQFDQPNVVDLRSRENLV